MNECVECGSTNTVPVWEDVEDSGETHPDYVGCTDCSTMVRPHLLPEDDESVTYGQMGLSTHEVRRLRTGNQHSSNLSVIEWQCVKAAASHHGVTDWTSKVDSTLTMDENIGLMREFGVRNNETTLRQMKSPREYKG